MITKEKAILFINNVNEIEVLNPVLSKEIPIIYKKDSEEFKKYVDIVLKQYSESFVTARFVEETSPVANLPYSIFVEIMIHNSETERIDKVFFSKYLTKEELGEDLFNDRMIKIELIWR